MTKHATATSTGSTKKKKAGSGRKVEKKPVDTCISMYADGRTKLCGSSRRVFRWRPWVSVLPLVVWLRHHGFVLNRMLNDAVLFWVGGLGDEQLRLQARKFRLLDEERELRQTMRVILRSGAFLDGYAAKLVEGNEKLSVKLGRQPLATLASQREQNIVKRILAQREAIIKELCEIEDKLLPEEEYKLKSSRSRARDKTKRKGGVKQRRS